MLYRQFKTNQMKNLSKTVEVSGTPPLTLTKSKGKNLKDYKIYGNSYQNGIPTPSSPIEVESVGDKTKNLFDYDLLQFTESYNLDATTGLPVNFGGSQRGATLNPIDVSEYNSVTLSLTGLTGFAGIIYSTFNGDTKITRSTSNNQTVTIDTTNATKLYICWYSSSSSYRAKNIVSNVQVEEGSATSYEPYGYKIPVITSNKSGTVIELPSEYQQVEHLKVSGTQFLQTNYTPVQGDEFLIKNVINEYSSNYGSLFSAGTGSYQLILLMVYNLAYYKYFQSGNATSINQGLSQSTDIKIKSNGNLYYNDILVGNSVSGGDVNTPLRLFKRADNSYNCNNTQMGRFLITNNGTKKIDLIPCYRKSDNKPGMYDIVNNVFYVNQGTGEFTVGDDVNYTKTNIYLNEPLRKIGNYADYIDFKNQKRHNLCTELSFNGNNDENWYGSATSTWYILGGTYYGITGTWRGELEKCNRLINSVNNSYNNLDYCFSVAGNGILYLGCPSATSKSDLRNWLSNNPLKIIAQLATPTEESITLPNILTLKGTNIVSVGTTINASNMLVKYVK